jgi:hypothetical protein
MKNRTNSGMHFDESTAQRPVEVRFCYLWGGRAFRVVLLIPERIKSLLDDGDFETVYNSLPQWHSEHFGQAISAGVMNLDLILSKMQEILTVRAVEFLYNRFIVIQAKLGNEAWQVPPTMSRIGPAPETDERWNDGSGRLVHP